MTFKVKSGFNVGSTTVVDQNSYFQQTESAASITPSLVLNFGNRTLDSRIQYSRASNGTFVAATGLIQNATSGVARFEHNPITRDCRGLLMEEQKTNLLLWSANTRGGGWTADQAFLDTSAITAPDGSATVSKMTEGTSSVGYRIIRQDPTGIAANTVYTASMFIKPAELANVGLSWFDVSGTGLYAYADFNLTTGTVVAFNETYANGFSNSAMANAAITPYANNWYRCSLTFTTGANTGGSIRLGLSGFASPGGNVNGVYVWGGQLEDRYTTTSLIYTTTAQVTRLQDDAKITGNNFFNFFNAAEGTIITESEVNSVMTGTQGVVTANRYPFLWHLNKWGSTNGTVITWYGSVVELTINGTYNNQGAVPAGFSKYAMAVANSSGQSATCLNGGVVANRSGTGFNRDTDFLGIGSANGSGTNIFNGTIKSLTFYPKRLDNNTLINLTTI